jgi:hypothetical protein
MPHQCLQCGSDDTTSVEMVYNSQTTRSTGTGLAVVGDQLAVAGFGSESSSLLAKAIAPPAPRSFFASTIGLGLGFGGGSLLIVIGIALASDDHRDVRDSAGAFFVIGTLLFILGFFSIAPAKRVSAYNARELPPLLLRWKRQWLCRRCGHRWIPTDENSNRTAAPLDPIPSSWGKSADDAVEQSLREAASSADGEGDYVINGVDKATKMDTRWHCKAASRANAKVKAELEGIIVTSIEKAQ